VSLRYLQLIKSPADAVQIVSGLALIFKMHQVRSSPHLLLCGKANLVRFAKSDEPSASHSERCKVSTACTTCCYSRRTIRLCCSGLPQHTQPGHSDDNVSKLVPIQLGLDSLNDSFISQSATRRSSGMQPSRTLPHLLNCMLAVSRPVNIVAPVSRAGVKSGQPRHWIVSLSPKSVHI
jgi:hypothetical protein